MTLVTGLYDGATGDTGISYDGVNTFTIDVAAMNAVITAYNVANTTSYPTYDSIVDSYEKLLHCLCVYTKIQELALTLDTFNAKVLSTASPVTAFGTRSTLQAKSINLAFPFTSDSNVFGDSDDIG